MSWLLPVLSAAGAAGSFLWSHAPAIAAGLTGLASTAGLPPAVKTLLQVLSTVFAATAGAQYAGPKIARHVIDAASKHE